MQLKLVWAGQRAGIDKEKIQAAVAGLLISHGVAGKVELGVSLVDDQQMKQLNQKHRGINQTTDVLSFPLGQEVGPDKVMRLGDVVVNKNEKNTEFLIKHGVKHCLGMDH